MGRPKRAIYMFIVSALVMGACNGILGIEEATRREEGVAVGGDGSPDATSTTTDSSNASDGDAGPGSPDAMDDADGGLGPFTCAKLGPQLASHTPVQRGPGLAFLGTNTWGLTWVDGSQVLFNIVDSKGVMKGGVDSVIESGSGVLGGSSRVAPASANTFVVAGGLVDAGLSFPFIAHVDQSGTRIGAIKTAAGTAATMPLNTDSVAADAGEAFVTARKWGPLGVATSTSLQHWSVLPTPTLVKEVSAAATSTASGVGFASAANRVGFAYVTSGGSTGGAFLSFDVSLDNASPLVTFTEGGDSIDPEQEIAIVGTGDRFAVAWVDIRIASNPQIYITSVDPLGARLQAPNAQEAQVSSTTSVKAFPRIAYDGKTIGVAWLEQTSGDYQIMFRRFTTKLEALADPIECVSCGTAGSALKNAFGFAVGGANEYGFAFRLTSADGKQHFNYLSCSGP